MTTLESLKRHADLMRVHGETQADRDYWHGYRIGLVGQHEHHEELLAGIGSADLARDARGRGYRQGCEYRVRSA